MTRRIETSLVVACALPLLFAVPGIASAESFGGFAKAGDSFLVDRDLVCTAVTAKTQPRKCERKAAGAVSAMQFRRPAKQGATNDKVSVRASLGQLQIKPTKGGAAAFRWDGADVSRVVGVYLHPRAPIVAVEYETRVAGRSAVAVIAVRMSGNAMATPPVASGRDSQTVGGGGSTTNGGNGNAGAPKPPATKVSAADQKTIAKKLRLARRALKRKKHRQVSKLCSEILALDATHGEAQYLAAAAKHLGGDRTGAIAALAALARSGTAQAPEWLVVARRASVFANLRADPGFRKAVGIDKDPSRPLTGYEKMMGFGGKWEQPLVPCDQPQVGLALKRSKRKFKLTIRNKCQGPMETTRLSGVWSATPTRLSLKFPNSGGAVEDLSCKIQLCVDSPGEDCVRCQVEQDLEFLLKVVRRGK